jgi:hypothetical protein
MMIVKNYVAPSKIHGVGLFAGEDIEKDQIIYVLTPGVDLVMTPEAIKTFGGEFSRFMSIYAYKDIKSGEITIRWITRDSCTIIRIHCGRIFSAGRRAISGKARS